MEPVRHRTHFHREGSLAVIVLNVDCVGPLLHRIWPLADVRICADGGANRLFRGISKEKRRDYIPHYIKGDLDSLSAEVEDYYRNLGTKVIRDPDQDTNDLQKCLDLLKDGADGKIASPSDCQVVVLGALGLRFDHSMANIHMLYKYQCFERFMLIGFESIAFLLMPGEHQIEPDTDIEGPICGLLPVGGACRSVTTSGLRWNLNGRQ